jgi:hypothetical protein
VDRSSFYHVDGQYNFDMVKWLDLQAGANFRYYAPRSFGTIFSDTILNPGDTLANGTANPKGDFNRLSVWEMGAYVQATKRLLNDRLSSLQGYQFLIIIFLIISESELSQLSALLPYRISLFCSIWDQLPC